MENQFWTIFMISCIFGYVIIMSFTNHVYNQDNANKYLQSSNICPSLYSSWNSFAIKKNYTFCECCLIPHPRAFISCLIPAPGASVMSLIPTPSPPSLPNPPNYSSTVVFTHVFLHVKSSGSGPSTAAGQNKTLGSYFTFKSDNITDTHYTLGLPYSP